MKDTCKNKELIDHATISKKKRKEPPAGICLYIIMNNVSLWVILIAMGDTFDVSIFID